MLYNTILTKLFTQCYKYNPLPSVLETKNYIILLRWYYIYNVIYIKSPNNIQQDLELNVANDEIYSELEPELKQAK